MDARQRLGAGAALPRLLQCTGISWFVAMVGLMNVLRSPTKPQAWQRNNDLVDLFAIAFALVRRLYRRWIRRKHCVEYGEGKKDGIQRKAWDEVKDAKRCKDSVVCATLVVRFLFGAGLLAEDVCVHLRTSEDEVAIL